MERDEDTAPGDREPPDTTPERRTTSRARRIWIRVLLVLATLVTVLGIMAVWANRQVLDPNNWANTSTALLDDPAIRTQVANYMVDQVYANVDVAGQLQAALPPRLQPLAGPAAGALQNLAQKAAFELLGRPRVQEAWRAAQRLTARQFIDIVENKSKLVTLNGNAVFVDLRPILAQLTQRLGLPASVTQSIPASAGRLKVMSSNQISTVQSAVNLVRGLAIVLPAVALLLFALAVYLYTGRRRQALLVVGLDLVIAGLVVLVARSVAEDQIVNSLASTDSVKPAVRAVWVIGTGMLKDIAQATLIVGLVVMLGASLAGRNRPAVAFRRAAAPWFRDRPLVVYGIVLALLLLIVLWGPIPATRKPIPVLIMIGLVFLGTEALRRQAAVEFPDAQMGDTWAAVRRRARRSSGGRHREAPPPAPIAGGAGPPAFSLHDERLSGLERLAALRDAGALTEDEFASEKAVLMSQERKVTDVQT